MDTLIIDPQSCPRIKWSHFMVSTVCCAPRYSRYKSRQSSRCRSSPSQNKLGDTITDKPEVVLSHQTPPPGWQLGPAESGGLEGSRGGQMVRNQGQKEKRNKKERFSPDSDVPELRETATFHRGAITKSRKGFLEKEKLWEEKKRLQISL